MKKWLPVLLAASMLLSIFPVSAAAAEAPISEPGTASIISQNDATAQEEAAETATAESETISATDVTLAFEDAGEAAKISSMTSQPPPFYPLEGIGGFISRLYLATLSREPDVDGLNYWTNAVKEGNANASFLVSSFFLSPEFIAKPHSNAEIVELVYEALLDRPSDAEGKAYWEGNLNGGISLTGMLESFVRMPEFAQFCNTYGIEVGSITITEARDKSFDLTKFLSRLYTNVLGRTAEPSGLNHWAEQFLSKKMNIESVAKQFVFSQEYLSKPHSDSEYLQMLYRTFMDREAEGTGFIYWQEQLKAGISREQVFQHFVYSEEFQQIQMSFGIDPVY